MSYEIYPGKEMMKTKFTQANTSASKSLQLIKGKVDAIVVKDFHHPLKLRQTD